MPANDNDKLEALRKQKAKITARIAAIEARQQSMNRKEENRVKVLIGVGFLADMELHPETRAGVVEVLRRAITTPRDRDFLKKKGWL